MAYSVNCHLVSAWILCSFGEIKQLDYLCPNYNLEVCISHTFFKNAGLYVSWWTTEFAGPCGECLCILIALWLDTDGGQHAEQQQKSMYNNSEMESVWRETGETEMRGWKKERKTSCTRGRRMKRDGLLNWHRGGDTEGRKICEVVWHSFGVHMCAELCNSAAWPPALMRW